jgi:hypothetical protein
MKQLKNNYSLIPLVFSLGLGIAFASFHSLRLLTRSPDIMVDKKNNPDPHNKFIKPDGTFVQYKYFSTHDYTKMKVDEERPKL